MVLSLCYIVSISILILINYGSISIKVTRTICNYKSKGIYMVNSSPKNHRDLYYKMLFKKMLIGGLSSTVMLPLISKASTLESNRYRNSIIELSSDDFWYPPYMIGYWNTSMSFAGGKFTNKIPLDVLSINNNVPGFNKYSIIFLPELGKDISNMTMRYVQLDSHPREDHPFNIRNLIRSFSSDTIIDDASYNFQKAPTWISSPANYWNIKYHDQDGKGNIILHTKKRSIRVFAGTIETIEFFNQKHERTNNINPNKLETTISDYAVNWKLAVPASAKDEFIKTADLAKTDTLVGTLDLLCFIQPTNDLYFQVANEPAAVFTYNVTMKRLYDLKYNTQSNIYPFVTNNDGAIELEKYFGY